MPEALKHRVGPETVVALAAHVERQQPAFDADGFVDDVASRLDALELKDRINLIADGLATWLPGDYPEQLAVVVAVAEQPLDDWIGWPLCSFVERHGVEHPDASLAAMPTLTRRWSCEFAIRPFLDRHLALTRQHLREWTGDDDETVRRLASEGTRPRLPWGPRVVALTDDPGIGIELLTELRHDESETVRRSVANHLNDVAKAHPALVIDLLRSWQRDEPPVDPTMVRHALRTLVKQGVPGALDLLGFTTEPDVEIVSFQCEPPAIDVGDRIELALELRSTSDRDQMLVVDVVVHHVNGSGQTSPKVFKWSNLHLEAGASARLTKRRRIEHASTRTYHTGAHRVDVQIAGRVLATTSFDLRRV